MMRPKLNISTTMKDPFPGRRVILFNTSLCALCSNCSKPFHPASFCLTLLISSAAFIRSFQNTMSWIPRYFSTLVLCWICKILTISFLIWVEVLEEKYQEDLWKLICCPATLENLYTILRILLAPLKTGLETLKPLGEEYQCGLKNSQPSCWDV